MTVPPRPHTLELVIGTYTEKLPHVDGHAEGVLTSRVDPSAGDVGPVELLDRVPNPTFVALSATGERLYAASQTTTFDGGGGLTAYGRARPGDRWVRLNTRPSGGVAPCHVAVAPDGRFVLAAHYVSGTVAVFPVDADGSLGAMADLVHHSGSGADPARQAGPHPHMIAFDPVTGELLVPDLGIDAVVGYALGDDGRLTLRPDACLTTGPGVGPRHLAFHPDGRHLFVTGELDSSVHVFRRTGTGHRQVGVAPTVPHGFTGANGTAAIRVSPSGRHVLVSNRGHDSVALLRVEPDGLTLVAAEPAHGRSPRDLVLTPDGRHVLVANQHSDTISVLALDEDTPALRFVSSTTAATPVCVVLCTGEDDS